jgi:hypothetical protein
VRRRLGGGIGAIHPQINAPVCGHFYFGESGRAAARGWFDGGTRPQARFSSVKERTGGASLKRSGFSCATRGHKSRRSLTLRFTCSARIILIFDAKSALFLYAARLPATLGAPSLALADLPAQRLQPEKEIPEVAHFPDCLLDLIHLTTQ